MSGPSAASVTSAPRSFSPLVIDCCSQALTPAPVAVRCRLTRSSSGASPAKGTVTVWPAGRLTRELTKSTGPVFENASIVTVESSSLGLASSKVESVPVVVAPPSNHIEVRGLSQVEKAFGVLL